MFQSTHPYRVWLPPLSQLTLLQQFQSTHPYRVWHHPRAQRHSLRRFNPHTHTGCDVVLVAICFLVAQVSIHTPIQGVTRCCPYPPRLFPVSIHTPIQGVTLMSYTKMSYLQFQSTHPYRVWQGAALILHVSFQFQSTHPYRVWPHIQQKAEYHDAKIDILRKTTK